MSDEELVDEELAQLIERKRVLLRKAANLRKEFVAWEKMKDKTSGRTQQDFLPEEDQFKDLVTEKHDENSKVKAPSVAVTNLMMGMKLSDVDKKWLSKDKLHLYTANIKTKVLECSLQVTVNGKDTNESQKVLKIVCNPINLKECYFLEISSWLKQFTEANDVSNLFGAISDYSEHNLVRLKFLKQLETNKTAYFEECTDDGGGVIIFMHAKDEVDFVYLKIKWVLRFVDSLWQIDNSFTIHPISATDEFLGANNELLQNFCKCKINGQSLKELWDKLCSAIEEDEPSQSSTGTNGTIAS